MSLHGGGGGGGGAMRLGQATGNCCQETMGRIHTLLEHKEDAQPFSLLLQRLGRRRGGVASKEAREEESTDAFFQLVDPHACFPRQPSRPCAWEP